MVEILATAAVVGFALGISGTTPPAGLGAVVTAFVLCTAMITVIELVFGAATYLSALGHALTFSAVCLVAAPLGAWWRTRRVASE